MNDNISSSKAPETTALKKKIPKLEDKPFHEFINSHLIPTIQKELKARGCPIDTLILKKDQRPVVGGECWIVFGQFPNGRRFWITFNSDSITSQKNISLSETSVLPSSLESFLIDEKKITLKLITSRFLQRLNGQKWLGIN
ncbi:MULTISPECIES: DUF2996 domain-containing protein [unclassified Prochlorococcus]|nr:MULTISPECIES: DUF2996 domain-containing protein [unclassified Prochlorococcus]